ncbi:MAG TPA: hypothetical protein VGS28_03360 [Candidatus Saccharimonadales bacterium]|nr:hypothetical protein [Candidatus Saccharimonadales bacterium]
MDDEHDSSSSKKYVKEVPTSKPEPSTVVGGPGMSKLMTALLVIIALLIAAGALYGTYYWQHQKVTKATNQVSSLNTQIMSLENQVRSLNGQLSKKPASSSSTPSTPTTTTVKLTQMGVEFTVPSSLSDLTYYYSTTDPSGGGTISGETFADVSASSIASQDSGCTANSTTNNAQGTALGMIIKGTGTGVSAEGLDVIKQFNGYFIAYSEPQATCSSSTSVDSTLMSDIAALKTALSSVQPIQ